MKCHFCFRNHSTCHFGLFWAIWWPKYHTFEQGSAHQNRLTLWVSKLHFKIQKPIMIGKKLAPHQHQENRKISHQLAPTGSPTKRCVDPCLKLLKLFIWYFPSNHLWVTVLTITVNNSLGLYLHPYYILVIDLSRGLYHVTNWYWFVSALSQSEERQRIRSEFLNFRSSSILISYFRNPDS